MTSKPSFNGLDNKFGSAEPTLGRMEEDNVAFDVEMVL